MALRKCGISHLSLLGGNLITRFLLCLLYQKVPSSCKVDSEGEKNISGQDGFPNSPLLPQRTQEKGKKKKFFKNYKNICDNKYWLIWGNIAIAPPYCDSVVTGRNIPEFYFL